MAMRVLVVDDSPTIRRVVGAALLRAGHDVASAGTVDEVHDRLTTFVPDLLLLDLTLPRIEDGLELLERLQAERAWHPPVVAMAARSDDLAALDARLRRLGVIDVVTKPFSPEALTAVVRHTLDKRAAFRRRSAADDFADDEHTVPARTRDATTLAGPPTTVDASATGRPRRPGLTGGFALIGDLGRVPLPEVLQLLQLQSQTGLLVVDIGERCVEVALEGGVVVGVVATDVDGGPASDGALRLGRYLVAIGGVDEARLEEALARTGNGLVGERLVSAGVVDADLVRRAISEQVHDLVVELLRARRGLFGLKPGAEHVPATALRPGWSIDALLFEALRRIDEWAVVEREVPSFDARFGVRGALDDSGLDHEEALVLRELADGPARVRDLVDRTPMLPFDVCRLLYRLAVLKRVQRLDDGDPARLLSDERSPAEPLLSSTPRRSDA
jgi:CheY-like chemotaxis protein